VVNGFAPTAPALCSPKPSARHSSTQPAEGLHVKTNFLNRLNAFAALTSEFQNLFLTKSKSRFISIPSCPTEGRLEIVTDAGQDAVDASGAIDEGALFRLR
jgi:hypothetical protein